MQINGVLLAFLFLIFILWLIGYITYFIFIKKLRSDHKKEWRGLGKPGLVTISNIATAKLFWWYIKDGEYETLNDQTLTSLGVILRISVRIFMILFWSFFLVFFFVSFLSALNSGSVS